MARRRVRLAFVFKAVEVVRALYFAQACDRIAYATRQLFYGFDAAASGRTQLFAQQQLSLAYDARERVVYLVPDGGDQFGYLYKLRFIFCNQRAQALLFRFRSFVLWLQIIHHRYPLIPAARPFGEDSTRQNFGADGQPTRF
jgi:hypothetical protein